MILNFYLFIMVLSFIFNFQLRNYLSFSFLIVLFFTYPSFAENPIPRYNSNEQIKNIYGSIPETCKGNGKVSHGGVECSLGADVDGSVVCTDGFRDSIEKYENFCRESRLQATPLIFENNSAEFSLRNLSSVKAQGIQVSLFPPQSLHPIFATGSNEVEAYGITTYTFSLIGTRLLDEEKKNIRPRVLCKNCETILGPVR